jgi:hypothetical protein
MNRDQIVENLIRQILNEKETNIGGPFKTDLENGPKNHGSRALGNWQSDNAWDVFAPAGSVVNSYTDGTVTKVRDTGKNSGKIFGTQVSIQGDGNYPDIFYTHLKNVKLKKGDVVKVGDRIGEVSEWVGHDKMTHVHIGLPRGKHLRDLLKNSSVIFSGEGEVEEPEVTDVIKNTVPMALQGVQSFISFLKGEALPTNIDQNDTDSNFDDLSTDSSVPFVDIAEYKITEPSSGDKDFYVKVLKELGAPVSKQNLLFFYAWRQAEGAKATFNPFNTTQPKEGSTLWNCLKRKNGKCVGGVRNYASKDDGIQATVKTLENGNYNCILSKLRDDKGAKEIANCSSDLKTWGTRNGITKVLNTKKINPPSISTSVVKSINESINYEKQKISNLIKKTL